MAACGKDCLLAGVKLLCSVEINSTLDGNNPFNLIHFFMRQTTHHCYRAALLLLLLHLLLPLPAAVAQTAALDSIYKLAQTAPNDSARLMYLRRYGLVLARNNFEKGMKVLEDGASEAFAKGYNLLAVDYYLNKGIALYEKGEYIQSIASDERTEKLYLQLPDNDRRTWGLAAVLNNLGTAYSLINELETAQQYYLRSIEQFEKLKDSTSLLVAHFNVAFIYIDMQQWEQANFYLQRSIDHLSSKLFYDEAVHSIARKAAICFRLNKMQEGLQLLRKADSLLPKASYELSAIYVHNARGDYYAAKGDWQQSLQQHRMAYPLSLQYNDPYYIADEAWEMGRAFLQLQQHDSAEAYLNKALQVARQYNYLPKVKFILKDMAAYYAGIGDYKMAWQQASALNNFTDSLVARQNHNRILLNDARYQSRQKETRISTLEKENVAKSITLQKRSLMMYVLLAALLVVLLMGALYYRTYRQKQQLQQQRIDQLETEKQLMAAEAILKGEEQERSRLAKDLHDGLGGMLSGVKFSFQHMRENLVMTPDNQAAFERGIDMLDSSIKELRRVAHNMMPESLVKFGLDAALKDFCHSVSESGAIQLSYQSFQLHNLSLDQQMAIGIYRVVQELINNVLKHAAAKNALVQINYQDGHMTITVEDDGKGFDTATLYNSGGMGWSNIQSRINYLQGKIDVQSTPDKGTSVFIEFDV